MMAVDTKQGGTAQTPPTNVAAANGAFKRRKRTSQLLQAAGSLPSVETSLDEFIARANATLLDASNWDSAEKQAKQEDSQRREADQLRWRAAEQQLRESEVREQSLRRQLDGLQGKLAEAEARAAVAGGGAGSHDGVIADLKMRLARSDERARAAEDRAEQLAIDLASKPSAPPVPAYFGASSEDAEERARVAEAKAAKAVAVAKAAAAGLNVQGEIAAIESGLVVPDFQRPAKSNTLVVGFAALLVGAAVMFAVSKTVLDKEQTTAAVQAPAAQAQPAQPAQPAAATATAPAPAPAVAAPAKPVVTPIEEPAPAPAAAEAPPAPAAEAKAEPAPAPVVEPKKAAPAAPVHHAAAPAHHAAPAPAKAKPASDGIADPFASGPAPAPAKKTAPKADKKANGGGAIVDPF